MSNNTNKLISPFMSLKNIVALCALLLFLVLNWLWLDYKSFTKTTIQFESNISFEVKKGENISSLTNRLVNNGQIESAWQMKLLVKLNPELAHLKVGEYRLKEQMKPADFLRKLVSGHVVQYSFSIIEGQTLRDIFKNLKQDPWLTFPILNADSFDANLQILIKQLGLKHSNPEGLFFPDTYFYSKWDSAFSVLNRSNIVLKDILANEWENRAESLPYKSPYEALIMASIIEKETGIASERSKIAGVFVRRLDQDMRLQTDPTVIYGIGTDYDGDITRKHLNTKTAYNTYRINGLPPTPIASAGREAIYAALNPLDGEALYFVADGTGGHYFSKTNEEHEKAVRRMLKLKKNE